MADPNDLALYKFDGCPWCERVRAALADLGLSIEERDIRKNTAFGDELQQALGRRTVPVLQIETAEGIRWLPESADIVRFLYDTFGDERRPAFLASHWPQRLGTGLGVVFFLVGLWGETDASAWWYAAAAIAWLAGNRAPLLQAFKK